METPISNLRDIFLISSILQYHVDEYSKSFIANPIPSMYGVYTYMYHKNQLNVGKYTIHGSYGNRNSIHIVDIH